MKALNERNPRNLRLILIGLVIVVLLCLVGALIYNIVTSEPDGAVDVDTPTPTAEPTDEGAEPTPVDEVTPTPTRVIGDTTPEPIEEPAEEPTEEPTKEPTQEPTTTPTVIVQLGDDTSSTTTVIVEAGQIEDVLENGGFETFDERGVGLNWDTFKNDDFIAVYSAEEPGPYVDSGASAQRITTSQAGVGNRHAGIYQQVDVVPNEPYTLTLKGQIRTGFGDINKSSFGYRMQYAISQRAIRNWEMVPEADWIELPWDEQLLHSPDTEFVEYTTEVLPTSDRITLFIRTWNKWADPGEAQFTIDSVSLTGPSVVVQTVAMETGESPAADTTETEGEEAMVDQGLPTTGAGDGDSFMGDGRFWGALLVLLLLGIGAIYRAKWVH